MSGDVLVVDHPAVADRLARLRDRDAPVPIFRRMVEEIGLFLAYEATRSLRTTAETVQTPMEAAPARRIANRPVVSPILRAGLGLLPGFLNCIDDAEVAHLGFYRDPASLEPVPYYANMPRTLAGRDVFVLDPMLATGNSGSAAMSLLASRGAQGITFVCLIAAPEGIATLSEAHPGVRIVTAAIDERLNDHGYIMPGLGDAGDRMFGSATSLPVSARKPEPEGSA
ncbi:MAG TPA: uracil phosphoribosyltransferase [Candidatus Lustribacter sp.]|nr:uracil phosphoribosyltransferase [Candidatus Lustribacter sp.]